MVHEPEVPCVSLSSSRDRPIPKGPMRYHLSAPKLLGAAVAVLLVIGGPAAAASAAPNSSDWPAEISVPGAYGMAFSQDGSTLYVAQREKGVAAVTSSGVVSEIINSPDAFMAVATKADGDILLTVDSDPNIYRIDMKDLAHNPEVYETKGVWKWLADVIYTSPSSSYLYSLAETPDGTIYYSTFQDRQINVLRDGVSAPLLTSSATSPFVGFSLLPDGGLGALDENGVIWEVSAAQLASGSVAPSALTVLTTGVSGNGFAALDGNTFYDTSGTKQTFQGAPADVPDAPTGLTATTGDGEVTLNWKAPENDGGADVTEYTVLVYNRHDDDFELVTTTETTTATVTGLTNGTPAEFVVSASNRAGESDYSDSVTATPFALDVVYTTGGTTLASDGTIEAGQSVTAAGNALPPGAALSLVLHSTPVTLATGVVDADGTFVLSGTIPADTPAGAHTLTLTVTPAGDEPRSADQAITVTDAAQNPEQTLVPSPGASSVTPGTSASAVSPAGAAGHLAATGTDDPEPALAAAAFLVAIGIAFSVLSRVRVRRV